MDLDIEDAGDDPEHARNRVRVSGSTPVAQGARANVTIMTKIHSLAGFLFARQVYAYPNPLRPLSAHGEFLRTRTKVERKNAFKWTSPGTRTDAAGLPNELYERGLFFAALRVCPRYIKATSGRFH